MRGKAGERVTIDDREGKKESCIMHRLTLRLIAVILLVTISFFGQEKRLFDVINFTDDMSFDWQKAKPQPLPRLLEDYALRTGKEGYEWALEHEPESIPEGSGEEPFQGLYENRPLDGSYMLWIYVPGPPQGLEDGFFCIEDTSSEKISRPFIMSIRFANTCTPMIQYRDFDNDGTKELIVKHIRHCGTNCTWVTEDYYNILQGPCLKRIFALETFGFWYDDKFPFKGFDSNDTCERSATFNKRKKVLNVKCVFERDLSYKPDGKLIRKSFQIEYKKDPSNGKYYPTEKSFTKKYSALISTQDEITSRETYEEIILKKTRGDWLGAGIEEIPELGKGIFCEEKEKRTIESKIDLGEILKLQKAVDEGHQPWRLDAEFVAAVYLKSLDPEIENEDCKLDYSTDMKAIVSCDRKKRYVVYLERIARRDGIWTVTSVEISDK